jgi:hypothetical protein
VPGRLVFFLDFCDLEVDDDGLLEWEVGGGESATCLALLGLSLVLLDIMGTSASLDLDFVDFVSLEREVPVCLVLVDFDMLSFEIGHISSNVMP